LHKYITNYLVFTKVGVYIYIYFPYYNLGLSFENAFVTSAFLFGSYELWPFVKFKDRIYVELFAWSLSFFFFFFFTCLHKKRGNKIRIGNFRFMMRNS
jgi:hypothetical protein